MTMKGPLTLVNFATSSYNLALVIFSCFHGSVLKVMLELGMNLSAWGQSAWGVTFSQPRQQWDKGVCNLNCWNLELP